MYVIESKFRTLIKYLNKKITMEVQFKAFYQELELDKSYDAIEFRLRFQKKLYVYLATSCPLVAEDLKTMKNQHMFTKNKDV